MGDTWLQLPPQMGGTRFGPFRDGIVQIGSDGSQCQIVLPPHFGIAPVHVTMAIQGPGSYIVQPVQRGFGLFVMKAGGSMFPISAAVQAGAGDTLVLGSPTGPRFTVFYEQSAAPGSRPTTGATRPGVGGRMAGELMRQQKARWMMRNPLYREFVNLQYRFRSGALQNPRVLVGLGMGAAGLVISMGTACLGGLGVLLKGLLG